MLRFIEEDGRPGSCATIRDFQTVDFPNRSFRCYRASIGYGGHFLTGDARTPPVTGSPDPGKSTGLAHGGTAVFSAGYCPIWLQCPTGWPAAT